MFTMLARTESPNTLSPHTTFPDFLARLVSGSCAPLLLGVPAVPASLSLWVLQILWERAGNEVVVLCQVDSGDAWRNSFSSLVEFELGDLRHSTDCMELLFNYWSV